MPMRLSGTARDAGKTEGDDMKIDTNAGITFESAMDMLLTLKNAGLVTTTESKAIRNRILDKL